MVEEGVVSKAEDEIRRLKGECHTLIQDNNTLRCQLGNLESRFKRETELTAAYRKVIKDMSEDL